MAKRRARARAADTDDKEGNSGRTNNSKAIMGYTNTCKGLSKAAHSLSLTKLAECKKVQIKAARIRCRCAA